MRINLNLQNSFYQYCRIIVVFNNNKIIWVLYILLNWKLLITYVYQIPIIRIIYFLWNSVSCFFVVFFLLIFEFNSILVKFKIKILTLLTYYFLFFHNHSDFLITGAYQTCTEFESALIRKKYIKIQNNIYILYFI